MSNHVSTLKALPAVGAFPVDCIHPQGRSRFRNYCDALDQRPSNVLIAARASSMCPVQAIYADGDVPEQCVHFAKINVDIDAK